MLYKIRQRGGDFLYEIELMAGSSIDEAVGKLIFEREAGHDCYISFNGIKLFSRDVTLDSAYLDVTGMTRDEFIEERERKRKEFEEFMEREEKKAKERIPYWIKEGHKLFPKDKHEMWDEIVPVRAGDLYHGMELDNILEIQRLLTEHEKGSYEEVRKFMDNQGHSGMSWSLVCALIKALCENGSELVEYLEMR